LDFDQTSNRKAIPALLNRKALRQDYLTESN